MKEAMPQFDFEREHELVLGRAMQLYKDRGRVRGQLWLEFPPSDKIRELRERVTRIEYAYEHEAYDAVVEDAIDVINYANFLVKQIERGQRG